ncbi:oligopeptide transporter 4-like isoform X3 [Rhododendron vialii]|uniref:oligopeptide transporter 4-like isoform X3 n=1 Tax=Rhododendron vialii TaxID=182163 RepID=UPI00265D9A3C|nr:oligopeptide transporter 4-like isoform X3 [Rhododendron vialii]
MGTVEIEHPYPPTTITTATAAAANDGSKKTDDDDDVSPIEQVRLTVANTDDPTLPVWTFRMWLLGVLSCCLLSFLNQFFSYRTEPLIITQITVQIAALPIGRLLHAVLPETKFRIPGCGDRLFSLNPGPFNMKEHVLITIFANAGFAFGNGPAYAVGIVDIIKALYQRKISFMAGWILVITTQVLGYGWAGLLRKYVVEPAHMWWPSNLVQVSLFREIYERYCASYKGKDDIHTKLMRKYEDIPSWWFYVLLVVTIAVSLLLCTILKSQVQLPWWGLLFACLIAFVFTLPISIITATTNQTPGLNIITEYVMGLIYPGRPIANVCFKVYGYMSMSQAVSFLSDFKLGHYMKIPPRSMFLVQFIGTIIAGTINMAVAWWLLNSIVDICQDELLPENSPWTCPGDRVFFDASVIWGLVGPKRIFGSLGIYSAMNWFFVFGAAGPIVVWLFHKTFPNQSWIPLVNLPVLLGATGNMPPATAVNYTSWIIVGTIFNFFIFRYRKKWWQRYNYVLSAALDAGVAFMAVLLYFSVGIENESVNWWGTLGEHCDLATCPTAKGIVVDGCPVY